MGIETEVGLQQITNFGENQRWYARRFRPSSEADVLKLLADFPEASIRAIGSGHSWSGLSANSDIAIDLSAFDSVTPLQSGGRDLVRVGAGCRLQDLLDRLHAATGRTLPTLGAIKRQTIAGAISTGTHGSGRQSLSHFVVGVRVAVFGANGQPEIREFNGGPELLAARCGLGCVGILLSVDLETVPKYLVAETVRSCGTIEEVIATFSEHPLTNFTLSPYGWLLSVFERRIVERSPRSVFSWLKARAFRLYGLIFIDIVFHLFVVGSRSIGPAAIKFVQKYAPLTLIKNVQRIDDSEYILTTNHHFFRHEEMEIFVKQGDLALALRFLRAAVEFFSGVATVLPDEFKPAIQQSGLGEALTAKQGSFVLHYPLFCRKILPEDTLISMGASTEEPLFSISIFTYDPPMQREPYYVFCLFVARTLRQLVEMRLHWGKHFPLRYSEIASLYPRLEEFRSICQRHDPKGLLRNSYTGRVLNLPPGSIRT